MLWYHMSTYNQALICTTHDPCVALPTQCASGYATTFNAHPNTISSATSCSSAPNSVLFCFSEWARILACLQAVAHAVYSMQRYTQPYLQLLAALITGMQTAVGLLTLTESLYWLACRVCDRLHDSIQCQGESLLFCSPDHRHADCKWLLTSITGLPAGYAAGYMTAPHAKEILIFFTGPDHRHADCNWLLTPMVGLPAGYATGYMTASNAKESLIFSAALVMAVRTAVWAFMHVLQKRFKYVAQQRQLMLGKNAAANGLAPAPTTHVELAPLMRGAWIVRPPPLSPPTNQMLCRGP